METDLVYVFLIALCLISASFFGGMAMVFVSANKLKIELDRKQGVFASRITSHLSQSPRSFVAAMLIGQQFTFILLVYLVWQITAPFLIIHNAQTWAIILPLLLGFVILFLCFVEFIPRALFVQNPNRWLNLFVLPIFFFYLLFYPLSLLVRGVSFIVSKIFPSSLPNKNEDPDFDRIDLNEFLQQATGYVNQSKDIDHEIQIFRNALDFSKVKARDCLVPRNEIIAIEITDSVKNLQSLFIETHVSKILVYKESIDHIIGYVHSFELFRKPEHIQHILRPVLFIPEPMPANEILELFIKQKRNMVVVVDEFGGTAGIITMEDIVEEIFGEIDDEHDKSENIERILDNGVFEFSARLEIDYLNEKYKLDLPINNSEYDTLGGLILFLAREIPEENIRIETEDYVLIPVNVNQKMIETVRIEPLG